MVNKAKIKGTRWETDNVGFLEKWWPKIKRAALSGTGDVGDLTHPETWAVECKDRTPISLPAFLREAEAEAANKGAPWFVALVKNRRSKGESGKVQDGYAVTRTRVWAEVAWQHERAIETLTYLRGLVGRRDHPNGINDSTFAVLAAEHIREWHDEFAAMGEAE